VFWGGCPTSFRLTLIGVVYFVFLTPPPFAPLSPPPFFSSQHHCVLLVPSFSLFHGEVLALTGNLSRVFQIFFPSLSLVGCIAVSLAIKFPPVIPPPPCSPTSLSVSQSSFCTSFVVLEFSLSPTSHTAPPPSKLVLPLLSPLCSNLAFYIPLFFFPKSPAFERVPE